MWNESTQNPQNPLKTEVHIHRAPTDESVRLLREMEQAAIDKITGSVHIGDNGFECVVNVQREVLTLDLIGVAIFSLNGKRFTVQARLESWMKDPDELMIRLRDKIAQRLATEMISTAMTPEVMRSLRREA